MNAIPKIYNEQTNEWIELMAKPIAEEVINIMKEDFMRNKEDIKLSEISYGNEDEFRYYIAYQSNVNQSAIFSLEGTLPFILNEILNKKDNYSSLSNKDVLFDADALSFIEPLNVFNVVYKDTFGNEVTTRSNELPQDLINTTSHIIKNNKSGNFTISYTFNDNAIEDKQYKFEKASE
ncbi:hypothetical protein [Staphylococcus capitis]|jgi:hypothetical protein|uniref:hypothetical protein n=1 Tax=Staphylococcus TaxID=1279 RepID=UPI001D02A725|nr:hypothetical protein [Staphylococcus capitis]MCC3691441.1 hypothetical protein [Staphylococcus capitis]MCC3695984.1 hypothetical protein [Staphylococcus capitis]MCC9111954.1 hypothetical protein [Staphylococcus capitis]DAP36495.1 MAG TPA: hypothetical protein [Caudoviricetes sp.]